MLNSNNRFGWLSIAIHWLVAVAIFGLFGLGLWMVELTYYDPWYKQGPDLHRSLGVVVLLVMLVRLILRFTNPPPRALESLRKFERIGATIAHWAFYLLVLLVTVSGYLISTADGRDLDVFGLVALPAFTTEIENQEDLAGELHLLLAWAVIGLAAIHSAAAIKHHFFDKDATLRRMLGNR